MSTCLCHPLTGMPGALPCPSHPAGLANVEEPCEGCGKPTKVFHRTRCDDCEKEGRNELLHALHEGLKGSDD